MTGYSFPAFRSEEWLSQFVTASYCFPEMLRNVDITPGYMAANLTAGLYKAKCEETKQQIKRALFRHAIFKIQNVEVASNDCQDNMRTLVRVAPNTESPHHWIDYFGTNGEGQKFLTEETWTVERCGHNRDYFVRYYKEGADGFSTRVVPASWRDRVQMLRFYFS